MRKPLMAGNWKMNLNHLEAIAVAQKLVYSLSDKDYDAVDIAIIPPFTDIRSIQTLIDGDRLRLLYGAQDLSPEVSGAFTGDISGHMLAKLGCTFVVIGHSERRAIHKEDDALINRKIKAAPEIMKQTDVDGALIGGASLDPEELAKIAKFYAVENG
jgi:triosephosphate isomerase